MQLNPYQDLPWEQLMPTARRKLLCSDKNYMFVLMECKAGTAQPPHSHPHTQITYIVSGNVPHAFCRVYRDTRWLEFFTPAREDILPREEQKEKE